MHRFFVAKNSGKYKISKIFHRGKYSFFVCIGLTKVYYKGTASEWGNISINSKENPYITDATRYYYSESQPTGSGNYWHYVNGEVTIW